MSDKKMLIRNSTAEFLIFTKQADENSIEVMVADENVWITQKMMCQLYAVSKSTISEHLSGIFSSGEQDKDSTVRNFRTVQNESGREVERSQQYYCLDVIIAVGYKVNSERAIQFRQWATTVLKNFATHGYVLDKKRLINGAYLSEEYYDHLIDEIKEIRASERKFYQKITDIYATSMDYDPKSKVTQEFFAKVQNKLHYGVHGHTAAELIVNRANAEKEHMGLTTWENAPTGKIVKGDVVIAKNYLNEAEIKSLNRVVGMYVDYAEDQAERRIPMTMEDWSEKLNVFLKFTGREVLENAGKVTAEIAKSFAESEFEKYRIIQDKLFESDFDKFLGDPTVVSIEKKKE